jgi:ABC-type multidrug transport system fused ATPase/permease subunit
VLAATIIQGVTSFILTQLLSKEGQRLIAELRRKVQEHVGRLPVAYYDANKTGALVSRIMTDVEGVRNLIGTGLVEFRGRHSDRAACAGHAAAHQPAADRHGAAVHRGVFALGLRKAFGASGRSSASAARSTPRSPAGSPNRWPACAW